MNGSSVPKNAFIAEVTLKNPQKLSPCLSVKNSAASVELRKGMSVERPISLCPSLYDHIPPAFNRGY